MSILAAGKRPFPNFGPNGTVLGMSEPPEIVYDCVYRNMPMAAVAFAVILASGFGSAWAALAYLPPRDAFLPVVEIAAATIGLIIAVWLASYWRHHWSADASAVRVRETHRYFGFWRGRERIIPFGQIAALRHVESGFDKILELETVSGERHHLTQALVKDATGISRADANGFNAFANALRLRIAAAGVQDASFQDGLGFWNKAFGLALLGLALALSTALSGLILVGVLSGVHMPNGAAMQGLGLVALLPIGAATALYRSWARRSFVLGLEALRDKIRARE
jgi:hypothetical protein